VSGRILIIGNSATKCKKNKKVAREVIDVLSPTGAIIGLWVKNANVIAKSI
jgi:hypothetical protein